MTYKEFERVVDELWQRTKNGELRDRQARFAEIERTINEYIARYGQRPNRHLLDRLATLCLYEEVTDGNLHKSRNKEFPIQSERQVERRESHQKPFAFTKTYGVDGKNHRKPTRKRR